MAKERSTIDGRQYADPADREASVESYRARKLSRVDHAQPDSPWDEDL